ncbi:MAG: hypothetical protein JO041_10810 [Acidobacteria bacterium]|nr:hypothetical protein [Acidobacteriota bacterium]
MADSLSLSSSAGIFECPKCRQTINTSLTACPYCSAPVDAAAAQAAAQNMAAINEGCSDASYIRIMAGSLWVFFGLSLLPFLHWPAEIGYLFLLFAVPFKIWRWRRKTAGIYSADYEFARARRMIGVSFFFWSGFLLLQLVLFGLTVIATMKLKT